jgi:hypothetical protein
MSALTERMADDMQLRGLAAGTRQSYLMAIEGLAKAHRTDHRGPPRAERGRAATVLPASGVNVFLWDALYTGYLCERYHLDGAEDWYEIPLD